MLKPIERYTFDTSKLVAEEPAQLFSRNKKVVFALACSPGAVHNGQINYSRWRSMPLPDKVSVKGASDIVEVRPGYYDYLPVKSKSGAMEWHVNFADPDLFVGYGSDLFAQDEIQVAEHPALASLKQKLNAIGCDASTVDGPEPTPVLIRGVERRCHIKTEPDSQEGRPDGLYGNAFGLASEDAIRRATVILDPPSITNLISIAAPYNGEGRYKENEILYILHTAYTGFKAAVNESGSLPVVIHSGYWGCGAFGGNRVLMTWLQALAAHLAGVELLVLHTGEPDNGQLKNSWGIIEAKTGDKTLSPSILIKNILAMGFEWGFSDGN